MEVLTTRTSQSLLHFPPSGNGTQRDRLNPLIVILGDRKSWAYLIGLLSFFKFFKAKALWGQGGRCVIPSLSLFRCWSTGYTPVPGAELNSRRKNKDPRQFLVDHFPTQYTCIPNCKSQRQGWASLDSSQSPRQNLGSGPENWQILK